MVGFSRVTRNVEIELACTNLIMETRKSFDVESKN